MFEEFKTKNIFKSISKTAESAQKAVIGTKNQQKLNNSVKKIIPMNDKKKKGEPKSNLKVYGLSSSNFNNNLYYDIFCPSTNFIVNQNKSLSSTDIISTTNQNKIEDCQNECQKDKTCTSFIYQTSNKSCILNKGYPTSVIDNKKGFMSGVKTDSTFNYSNLNTTQKTNIQKYCLNKKITELTGNDKINIEECIKGIKNNKNNDYIDLNTQCVWNKMNSIGKGRLKNNSVREDKGKLGNAIGAKNMDKYQNDFKSLIKNSIQYFDTNKKLSKFDKDFKKYNLLNELSKAELLKEFKETSEGTIDKTILLNQLNTEKIGSDKIEGFENILSLTSQSLTLQTLEQINIFVIVIVIIIFILMYYYYKY